MNPRPITTVEQVELTTFCDLRCVYCPSKDLDKPRFRGQPRMHMALETFERTLAWASFFQERGTQGEFSLTGIGESLLHPELAEICRLARLALRGPITFSTNGLKLTDERCEMLARYGIKVWVSLHRPEKAHAAIVKATAHGIYIGPNMSAATSAMDWAGQLEWEVNAPTSDCRWLGEGWAAVLVDGRISTCCLDAAAKGVIGSVFDDPSESLLTQPFSLCGDCFLRVPGEELSGLERKRLQALPVIS